MANEAKTPAVQDELDEIALQIFAAQQARVGGEQLAIESYRRAEAFLAVKRRYRAGEFKPKEPQDGPQLADCCVPNQKRTHPHNLVSQRFGDLSKVNRIKQWLDRNPTPEKDPEELLAKLNREFPDLGWDEPTVNVARAIFPVYCKN